MIKSLLDFLFENTCKYCGREFTPTEQGYLCETCLSKVEKYELFEEPYEIPLVDGYEFFAKYEGIQREMILLYKFHSVKPFGKIIAEKIKRDLEEFLQETKAEVITYVPVHLIRWWSRGYDHNEEVVKHLKIPYKKLIKRVKYSRPLAKYKKEKREKLLEKAYKVIYPDEVKGKRILVYDDILTTGSTANAVATALKGAGASEVFFYFFLREA